ncbi:DUF3872 domain-containing protein [Sphingobacterium sp. SRCM116780]|uniref:DUF3872 domain-containing protein n=1 Tax=Sphingobacterium sp. SRCM116780 TaxID=2907623 RepID=UPI001F2F27A2|nr:DUF3872 domain-containing protein [Sphingobacterium sp. SRCM116780]UIR57834.1 DUF3872 domain-containing protein [Sphingobacterium sp. SRCM116780]
MKKIMNKWQMSLGTFLLGLMMMAGTVILSGCDKESLDIQENFSFELNVMPVPKSITFGETVEIRISIISNGDYAGNKYYLRYFQNEGQGSLSYFGHKPYFPNDLYALPEKEFRLYYTSGSTVSQNFDIWIVDSFGNEKQISFQFNNQNQGSVRIN